MERDCLYRVRLVSTALLLAMGTVKADSIVETGSPDEPTNSSMNSTTLAPLEKRSAAPDATLNASDLKEYPDCSPAVQRLIDAGLALTRENLGYTYGSDDPANGGMDCSGTIYYLLRQAGIDDVPRDSSGMYGWVWKQNLFRAVESTLPDTFELGELRPGDLMFWTGTYRVDRDPPVTHVMIYLGTSRLTHRRVMVGASDGRTFNDRPRWGVSVFDFKMPGANAREPGREGSRFIGYGPIPGLEKTGEGTKNVSTPSN